MKRDIALLVASLTLASCAGVPIRTPAQAIYGAIGAYETAAHGAAAYVAQPTAAPAAVRRIHAARADPKLRTALNYAHAYVSCRAQPVGQAVDLESGEQIDCTLFDFTSNTALGYASTINAVVTVLLQATGGTK